MYYEWRSSWKAIRAGRPSGTSETGCGGQTEANRPQSSTWGARAPARGAHTLARPHGRTGDHCQVTLERWLPIDGEPGIENAVNAIRAILAASARPDPARTIGATTEP